MTDPVELSAIAALSSAHSADPNRIDGRAAEGIYVERVFEWVKRLEAAPSTALRLAARCQHLERWAVPRASYPEGRAGYHRWRRAVQDRQGTRAEALLLGAGCQASLARRVAELVAKRTSRADREAQALEDAACLVFLQHELGPFVAQRSGTSREKLAEILRKTWRKMSPAGREHALAAPLAEPFASVLAEVAAQTTDEPTPALSDAAATVPGDAALE